MGKYRMVVLESERGWGQSYERWDLDVTSSTEAWKRADEMNSRNPTGYVPDYYIQAQSVEKLDEETGTWFTVKRPK